MFHDQLTDTEHDLCTSDAHYFRICSFRRRRAKFPNRRIGLHSLFNSATDSHNDIIPTAMHNEKTVVTNFTKCVMSHSDGTMYGHFAVYESLNRCTRARFCCRLEVGSPISAFRFPLCVSIVNFKNTTPSGDIPREHYRHCQYRLRGLRYIAHGLASSIINGNVRRYLVISHASIIDNIVNTGYGA